jgi:hypothetical protein
MYPSTAEKTGPNVWVVHRFYAHHTGSRYLSEVAIDSIQSFSPFYTQYLWCYNDPFNLPHIANVYIKDASLIVGRTQAERLMERGWLESWLKDEFQFKCLYTFGGLWVDNDRICLGGASCVRTFGEIARHTEGEPLLAEHESSLVIFGEPEKSTDSMFSKGNNMLFELDPLPARRCSLNIGLFRVPPGHPVILQIKQVLHERSHNEKLIAYAEGWNEEPNPRSRRRYTEQQTIIWNILRKEVAGAAISMIYPLECNPFPRWMTSLVHGSMVHGYTVPSKSDVVTYTSFINVNEGMWPPTLITEVIDFAKRVRMARAGNIQHIRIEVASKTKMMIIVKIRLALDFLSHVFGSTMVAVSVVGTAIDELYRGHWDVMLADKFARCRCYDPVNGSPAVTRPGVKLVCEQPAFCVALIWYAYKMVTASDGCTGDGPSNAVLDRMRLRFGASQSEVAEYILKFEKHAMRMPQWRELSAGDAT